MRQLVIAIVVVLSFFRQLPAQEATPIWELEEVIVSDTRLKQYAEGHKTEVLADSTVQRNGAFLTSLLAYNSNIYFKENGFGMVSSPSFRGTNASHTAVVWNGININSQLNGQVDFNTINPFNYTEVGIRSGGGSVQYGTGAIGGSIHLNNDLRFEKHFDHQFFSGYGSFDTKTVNYKMTTGNEKYSSSFGVNYNASDNDYRYLETDERNINGEFENLNFNFNAGYVLSGKQVLRLYHQSFIGNRNLSGNLVAPGRSRYKDNQYRTQLEWGRYGEKTISRFKVAHMQEAFRYFENKDSDLFSDGRVTTLLARYALDMKLSEALRLNSYLEYDHFRGNGSSFGSPQRNDISATATLKHDLSEKLVYNFSMRKDFSSDFSSPLIFSLDGNYDVNDWYTIQFSASRNFRMPTFNDLYWQPGGNLDLDIESSYQVDLGQHLKFDTVSIHLNGYYIATDDMIRWLPNTEGLWSPTNVDKVAVYGLEAEFALACPIGKTQKIDLKSHYAYTVSKDQETDQQLIYVPFHRTNASLAYSISDFSLFYQHLYNGSVSIIGGELEAYQVANFGGTYHLKTKGKLNYSLGVTLQNLFNTYYENVALRPMPNRNIQTRILVNF